VIPRLFSSRAGLQQQAASIQQQYVGEQARFPGAEGATFTTSLKFLNPKELGTIPCYRVMDTEGKIVDESYQRDFSDKEATKMYGTMVATSIMDLIMLDAQRQGRISFYMVSAGEEAITVGSASALEPNDPVFAQYREQGVFLQRGFGFTNIMAQLFGTKNDNGRGRNMPVHYGSAKHHIHTIGSTLATQLPQASGAAYAVKMQRLQNPNLPPRIVVGFFGEGAASEGDFHAALNIAATRQCPVLFICRNNGFAISTPTVDQYRGDGIASRGPGYGIDTIRVDGNDILAMREATKRARQICLGQYPGGEEKTKPVLMEAMSYRVSHHSTSDDSFAYRARVEVEDWKRRDNPITRFRKYLESQSLWDESREKELRTRVRKEILKAFNEADREKKPPIRSMFEDVYEEMTPEIKAQMEELRRLVERYPDEYDVSEYEGGLESLKS
jgi:2-oxoisovalerate dehydrogenase E1 component alpha subunit